MNSVFFRSGCVRFPGQAGLALFLILVLAFPAGVLGQQAPDLQVVVIAGGGAVHNLDAGEVTIPVVEVQDGAGNFIEGAEVTFQLPSTGPSGTFYGASRRTNVTTDTSGRAAASGFAPNAVPGDYLIEVTAQHQGRQATASIPQTNLVDPAVPPQRKRKLGWRLIAAIVVGVGIAITAIILRDNEDSAASTSEPGS